MNCNACNLTHIDLGCYSSCSNVLALSHQSLQIGVYTLLVEFRRTVIRIPFEVVTAGQVLEFELHRLNALYSCSAKVLQPDGTELLLTQAGQPFDVLRFTTKIGAAGSTVFDIQN